MDQKFQIHAKPGPSKKYLGPAQPFYVFVVHDLARAKINQIRTGLGQFLQKFPLFLNIHKDSFKMSTTPNWRLSDSFLILFCLQTHETGRYSYSEILQLYYFSFFSKSRRCFRNSSLSKVGVLNQIFIVRQCKEGKKMMSWDNNRL